MAEASFYTTRSEPKGRPLLAVGSLLIEDPDIDKDASIEKEKKIKNEIGKDKKAD